MWPSGETLTTLDTVHNLGQVPRQIATTLPVLLVVYPVHHDLQRKFRRQHAQHGRLVNGRQLVEV